MKTSIQIFFILFILIAKSSFAQTYKVEEVSYNFEIIPVPSLNSKYDDFAPVFWNDNLIFTSGRESNLVLMGENNWGKTGFLNVFSTKFKELDTAALKIGPVDLFSQEIANNNHTGPVSFSVTGDTIFYTQLTERVKRVKERRYPQLYMAEKIEGKWKNVQSLPFNDKAFSYGHPCWDAENQKLYFVSTAPGGKGGRDIYSSNFTDGSWSSPENLEINTEDDEMFPFIIGNDLFFSSNRAGGKGDLDIYWKQLGTTEPLQNVKDLNTSNDDHGLFITPGHSSGFVSRKEEGNDNIYMLSVERKVRVTNELAGKFTYRNLGTDASGLHLQLIHEENIVIEVDADDKGEFRFRELPFENYTIKTLSNDNLELTLFDSEGNPNTFLIQDGEGKFQYKKVDYATAGTLTMLEEMNDGSWLDFTDISGQFVYENIPGQYGDSLTVMLVDEDGNVIFEELTDPRGNFTFINVPTDQNYTITTKTNDEDLFLLIFDQDGNVFTQLKSNNLGEFIYKKIDPDYANNLQKLADEEDVFQLKTQAITGNFNYRKLEGEFNGGLKVYLFNEHGALLDSATTDAKGQFSFRGLDPELTYLFKMDENDPNFVMDDFNLHIEDRYGKVLYDLYRAEDGFFKYKNLDFETDNALNTLVENENDFELLDNPPSEEKDPIDDVPPIEEKDPIEEVPPIEEKDPIEEPPPVEEKIIPVVPIGDGFNIYFDRNSSYADFEGNEQLQALVQELKNSGSSVVISAFASCRSSDEYNLWISERRGNRVQEYLLRKGIPQSKISVLAFGETKLVNNCGDGEDCPDEEHAKNRRVELILSK